MASIQQVSNNLNNVLDKAAGAGAALQNAAELAEDAQQLLTSAGEGSLQADIETTNAQFAEVVSGVAELHEALGNAISGVEQILHNLEVEPGSSDGTGDGNGSGGGGDGGSGGLPRRLKEIKKALPPPVQRGAGQKTHGRWFTPGTAEGAEEAIVSGKDRLSTLADQKLINLGARRAPVTTSDVEIKLAVHMAETGIARATVVINNTVCEGPFGCDTLVPVLLPEGSALTVFEVTSTGVKRKVYWGGAKSPWR